MVTLVILAYSTSSIPIIYLSRETGVKVRFQPQSIPKIDSAVRLDRFPLPH